MPTCIRCGREAPLLVDGRLCPSCYLELHGFGKPPRALELTYCPRCGSYRFHGSWYPSPEGGLEEAAKLVFQAAFKPGEYTEYVRAEEVSLDEEAGIAVVRLAGRLRGDSEERVVTYTVPLRLQRRLCPACFRRSSGAPTAIVQVRGYGGRLDASERMMVERQLASLPESLREAIISVNEVREGIDINMLDQDAARALAARLRSSLAALVKESHKLVTRRRDGRPVTRLTLSVRLPFFHEGSLADYHGGLVRVESVAKGYVVVRGLGSRRYRRLRVEEAWRELSPPAAAEETRVVIAALEPGWVHLQEMEGAYSYLEIPRSQLASETQLSPGSDAVLIKYNGRYYLLPRPT